MVPNGGIGFLNLHVVEVELNAGWYWRSAIDRVQNLSFHTLEQRVSFWHGHGLREDLTPVDPLEEQLLAKFSIASNGRHMDKCWERYSYEIQGKNGHYYSWLERTRLHHEPRIHQRMTRKTMCV